MSDEDFDDRDAMLAALEAHGRAFLQSFPASANPMRGIKRKRDAPIDSHASSPESSTLSQSDVEGEEWQGFPGDEDDNDQTTLGASKSDERRTDRSDAERLGKAPVVVDFSHTVRLQQKVGTVRLDKTFMSSKVSKVRKDTSTSADTKVAPGEDAEQQISDLRNDAELHRLIHTQLLSGSLDPMMDLKPSQKRKAMAGRVLEAAGKVKLGVGENDVRKEERNKAAKRIREGINRKEKERAHRDLEEAKQLGNYHPTIKRLFAASSQSSETGKRARGIGSGVGRFVGGALKLSQTEIASVQGPSGGPQARRASKNGKR
ncbi:hypothetical protein CALCODRAFT_490234 [Calocera cornea HHB12733]|uniref:Uncharacterized protein n=1 Tax=Calocera cornea HHB12733 TaxID=1353952 RepID=A0A165JXL7_9BASI|nr:hypothetical protein CALCODRAFT_490234 [Calocera cornea HHB12733]